jgi:hypothetical protein
LQVATSLISIVLECEQNRVYFGGHASVRDLNFICEINSDDIGFSWRNINMLYRFLVPEDECGDIWLCFDAVLVFFGGYFFFREVVANFAERHLIDIAVFVSIEQCLACLCNTADLFGVGAIYRLTIYI